jgi:hypothetical protein
VAQLRLAEFAEHSVYRIERRVNLFSDLGGHEKQETSADGSDHFHWNQEIAKRCLNNPDRSTTIADTRDADADDVGGVVQTTNEKRTHLCTSQDNLPRHEDE